MVPTLPGKPLFRPLPAALFLAAVLLCLGGCGGGGGAGPDAQGRLETVYCEDGTVGGSRAGCQDHGGIAPVTGRCTDGVYTNATNPDAACHSHGGVDQHFNGSMPTDIEGLPSASPSPISYTYASSIK